MDAMARLVEQNAAKILAMDLNTMTISRELEQKRRGFSLLAELAVSLRQHPGYESVFIPASRRINAALNMQRTIVLANNGKGLFTAEVLQGYSTKEKAGFAGRRIEVPSEFLDPDSPALVTGAEPADLFKEIRDLFGLPYFISSPIMLHDEVYAILITGRLTEAAPYFVRLSRNDAETVQAIGALLASIISGRRLVDAEERNRIMADSAPLGCLFLDVNGNLTDCNQETLSMFDFSQKEDFLECFDKLYPEYQPDGRHSNTALRKIVKKAFVSGSAKTKWTHLTSSGKPFPVDVTFVRVPKGEDYALATYMRDLREQEAAEAKMDEARSLAERSEKAKSEFIASVSHEIRTPLNAIVAMASAVGDNKGLNENQRSLINQGLRSVKLLTSAIETILDFSRLDSGRMSLEIGEFSVRDLVCDIGGMMQIEAREKSLYLQTSVDSNVPELLSGDSKRLQQALLNIVANAVKFTETGGVDINVFSEKTDREGEVSITFEVRDTGIGVSEEQMSEMFKPLYSCDTAYNRKYGGLGMGLSISHSLAALMGGEITCESRPGEGSSFKLRIPLSEPATKTDETREDPDKPNIEALRGLRVLVAEDNNINQMIIETLLSSVGIEVTLADTGVKALEMLQNKAFDIVLMDIQMPEMDGLTATAQIRADRRHDNLPILAMTANAGEEHLEESMRAGMNDHLTKPLDTEQLYSALIKWRQPLKTTKSRLAAEPKT